MIKEGYTWLKSNWECMYVLGLWTQIETVYLLAIGYVLALWYFGGWLIISPIVLDKQKRLSKWRHSSFFLFCVAKQSHISFTKQTAILHINTYGSTTHNFMYLLKCCPFNWTWSCYFKQQPWLCSLIASLEDRAHLPVASSLEALGKNMNLTLLRNIWE